MAHCVLARAAATAMLVLGASVAPLAYGATVAGTIEDSGTTWVTLDGTVYQTAPGTMLATPGGERLDPRELPRGTPALLDLNDAGKIVAVRPMIPR